MNTSIRLSLLLPLVLTAVLAPGSVSAQTSDYAQWVSIPITADIGEGESRPQLWLDMHARRFSGSTTTIFRPGFGWRFSKSIYAHGGYGLISGFRDSGPTTHEHRIWEQFIYNLAPGARVKLQSRTRFEQRMSADGGDVGFRVREFVRAGWHVADGSPFQILIWDEIFLGLNEADWGPPQGYDQNRLFLGAGVDVASIGGRVEMGYMNNHLGRDPDVMHHTFFTQVVIGL